MKYILASVLMLGFAATAFAQTAQDVPTPEIDGSTAASAITLISGAAFLLRSRRKR